METMAGVAVEAGQGTSVSRTARARARAQITAELLATARRHLAEHGAAALSLRSIARDMGMTSSAVYRYVASRDELLTMLIIEAYGAVADTAEEADRSAVAGGAEPGERWLSVARSIRAWAWAHPHQYALIYGTPVPDYRASPDTIPNVARIWRVVTAIVAKAVASGSLNPPVRPLPMDGVFGEEALAFIGGLPSPPFTDAMLRGVGLYTSLIGTISSELFGHYVGFTDHPDTMFDLLVAAAADGVGLEVPVAAGRHPRPSAQPE